MKKIALLVAVVALSGCNKNTGHGEKVGTIIKLAEEGYWVKTWEGEMVRGGMNGGSGGFSTTPLHFTVRDLSLLPQVQDAFEKQKEVVVTYDEYSNIVGSFYSECKDSCKYLTSIREREPEERK
jgi:hypothetical protein